MIRPPKQLTGEGLSYWRRNAPHLSKDGLLSSETKDTFVILCVTYAKLVQAEAEGLDAIKFVALNKQYQQLSKLFGLDPTSRKKLVPPKPSEDFSALQRLLAGDDGALDDMAPSRN